MKKKSRRLFLTGVSLIILFVLWTVLVCLVDVQTIGPQETKVGFATMNGYVHSLTGVNMSLYEITDWLSVVPIGVVLGFAILGLVQWIKRKSLLEVDKSILALGGFYIVVMVAYIFFEAVVINYRPVLINGCLEASYPSSTTVLVMCVMWTAIIQLCAHVKNDILKRCVIFAILAFITFMVIGRTLSGVHWFSDIIGGALLSSGLVMMYHSISTLEKR